MTLLGELHGHNLQLGLSISHLTRAISVENVCEHPLDPFFVVFIIAKPECKLFFSHASVCFNDKKKKKKDKHKVGKKLILISYFLCG